MHNLTLTTVLQHIGPGTFVLWSLDVIKFYDFYFAIAYSFKHFTFVLIHACDKSNSTNTTQHKCYGRPIP